MLIFIYGQFWSRHHVKDPGISAVTPAFYYDWEEGQN